MAEVKRAIAAWLCPELAEDAERYHRLWHRVDEAHRWFGEFRTVARVLAWARDVERHGAHPSALSIIREDARRELLGRSVLAEEKKP